jgi:hypothetical protein
MTAYSSQGLESYSPLFLGSQSSGFANGTATQVYVYMYGSLRPVHVKRRTLLQPESAISFQFIYFRRILR